MAPFYTGKGDSGETDFLGKGRVSKSSARIEAVGCIDEANAVIGFARSLTDEERSQSILLNTQKKLYILMTELSALPDEDENFKRMTPDDVKWVEKHINKLEEEVPVPREFILPGDTCASGALDIARAVVRRAERRVITFLEKAEIDKPNLVAFLNRLSSLLFILEVAEASRNDGSGGITLEKEAGE